MKNIIQNIIFCGVVLVPGKRAVTMHVPYLYIVHTPCILSIANCDMKKCGVGKVTLEGNRLLVTSYTV